MLCSDSIYNDSIYNVRHISRDLPEPDPDAAAHSARLIDLIREEIAASGGSVSFARYMELALYAPGLGYYSAGLTKFGAQGDFMTAPEISPLFARCIARQCCQVLEELGGGDFLELGAGSGRLARDLLLELERLDALPQRYLILELSADLRERQHRNLQALAPHLLSRVSWLESLPNSSFTGIIFANEVFDAMPVHRFCINNGMIHEVRVGWDDGRFIWVEEAPAEPKLAMQVEGIQAALGGRLPTPYLSEINLMIKPWIEALADRLECGILLCIDYGYPRREYYHPQRCQGTLMCHYRHRAHPDPLVLTGLQDITAFVDFTAVADAGRACGLEMAGYTTQAHFLIACGLDKLLTELRSLEPDRYLEYAQQAKVLTLPGEMGERFKVMALAKNWEASLLGFQLSDHRGRL